MELLTGKAREHFEVWLEHTYQEPELFGGAVGWDNCYTNTYNLYEQDNFPVTLKAALITEWFDSVGIITETEYLEHLTQYTGKAKDISSKLREDIGLFKTRPEARIAAISKANDIYNAKHQ